MNQADFARRATEAQNSLYRVSCAYLRGEHDRLDAIQECIARAWQKRDTLRDPSLFNTWLTRILIRECVNIQRKQRRLVPTEAIPPPPDAPSADPDLRAALDALPEHLRVTVVLHYMEGYSVAEIGTILHLTRGMVCSRLARGRDKLRAMLKEDAQ